MYVSLAELSHRLSIRRSSVDFSSLELAKILLQLLELLRLFEQRARNLNKLVNRIAWQLQSGGDLLQLAAQIGVLDGVEADVNAVQVRVGRAVRVGQGEQQPGTSTNSTFLGSYDFVGASLMLQNIESDWTLTAACWDCTKVERITGTFNNGDLRAAPPYIWTLNFRKNF